MKRLTLSQLKQLKQQGEKIAMLTAYDASFAILLELAGVDVLLVGDSLGMVIQGQESTVTTNIEDMIYHCKNVVRGSQRSFIIADMPFMTYASPPQALHNAGRLMREGGANMVKLEGGAFLKETTYQLSLYGVPVCAHLGLLPQSIYQLGSYQVQGKDQISADRIYEDAVTLEQAGADMLILECVPAALGKKITQALKIPVISCGAGPECDGQVLVLYDMLGITQGKAPRFNHNFLTDKDSVLDGVKSYVHAVKNKQFPSLAQSY
ncbi:3-methyl-2-oxobutanoate hydroxymethyltransferase [Candidatus Nitrosacidococcus sp. I8]|uniref:3-methyl-2-oxobutanoate hydroxymethyltransferase n=1 Tax=Candidatus Nitrosacidococcus sp. I8 TaxID=2942908 RepID=UPI002226E88F|nr:3-methyl-2-oxobutanoate hydroxymethyltransferase [Candidatus Nitrosacidococcus sp. I8]CAH9018848.1 3-methyl-2-oxobutanoate hydroxymethyltransferase [Candidatus Nitrosacidococcus sp. I8]